MIDLVKGPLGYWSFIPARRSGRSSTPRSKRRGPANVVMVESIHPKKTPEQFLFHKVKFFVDQANWACRSASRRTTGRSTPGAEPELMEEYTYTNLKRERGPEGPRLRPQELAVLLRSVLR